MSALEEIEIFLRCNLAYFHVHKYGALGYLQSNTFFEKHNHAPFLNILNHEVENNKKVLFVKHYIAEYGGGVRFGVQLNYSHSEYCRIFIWI